MENMQFFLQNQKIKANANYADIPSKDKGSYETCTHQCH